MEYLIFCAHHLWRVLHLQQEASLMERCLWGEVRLFKATIGIGLATERYFSVFDKINLFVGIYLKISPSVHGLSQKGKSSYNHFCFVLDWFKCPRSFPTDIWSDPQATSSYAWKNFIKKTNKRQKEGLQDSLIFLIFKRHRQFL